MSHNGTDKRCWGQVLPVYLSGKAQQSFAQVDVSALDDYDLVKSTMLESLGDTPSSADRRWWSLCRRSGEEAGTFYLRIRSTGLRRLDGLVTKEEVCEKVILSRFLSLLAPDCYNCVIARQPQTGLEAAKLVQEYEEARTFARRQQPWKHASHQNNQHYRREQGTGGGVSTGGGVPTGGGVSSGGCVSSGSGSSQNGSVSSVVQSSNGSSNQASGGKYFKGDKQTGNGKPITCYGCGEPGHIRPNCPNKIRRVS